MLKECIKLYSIGISVEEWKRRQHVIQSLFFSAEFQRNFHRFSLYMDYGVVKQAHFTGLQIVLQAILQVGFRLIATPKMYVSRRQDLPNSAILQQAHPCRVFPMFAHVCPCFSRVFPILFSCSFGMLFQHGWHLNLSSDAERNGLQTFLVTMDEGDTR